MDVPLHPRAVSTKPVHAQRAAISVADSHREFPPPPPKCLGEKSFRRNRTTLVNGDALLQLMHAGNRDESQLAAASGLSDQTIRNYLGSTSQSPWRASEKALASLARLLAVSTEELQLTTPTETDSSDSADPRLDFLGFHPQGPVDSGCVMDISGTWMAKASLPPTCTSSPGWCDKYTVKIVQVGASFTAIVKLNAIDALSEVVPFNCRVTGHSLEAGNYLLGQYQFQSTVVRLYGMVMLRYHGDRISGAFIGRNTRLGAEVLQGAIECERCSS